MPSRKVFDQLEAEGLQPGKDPYLKYDCLESNDDLTFLFEALSSVKDKNGHPAILTANSLAANPDFDRIRAADFSTYIYESVLKTLKRYPHHDQVEALWRQGMSNGVYKPQYHGREHLNVDAWMTALRGEDPLLHKAFNLNMLSVSSMPSTVKYAYMAGLDFFNSAEEKNKETILTEGLELFEKIFGLRSKSFIANCYIWNRRVESTLSNLGIRYLQGIANQFCPTLEKDGHSYQQIKHYTGQKNRLGQYYIVRNAFFEPSLQPEGIDVVGECLKRIKIAFKWNKPAVISSHRLNFIGGIDQGNRDRNLKLLESLLNRIVRNWPNVEFMATDNLGDLIHGEKRG